MGDASHCRWLWHVCRRRSREWSQQSQHASSAAVVVQGFPATSVAPFRRARGAATAGRTSERRHPWPCAAEDARRRIHARMISNGLGFSSFFLLGCRPINRSLCCSYSIDCAAAPVHGRQTSCSTRCGGAVGPLRQALGMCGESRVDGTRRLIICSLQGILRQGSKVVKFPG